MPRRNLRPTALQPTSPSRVGPGVCWDNAVAGTFFSSLKNEMYHPQVFSTKALARMSVAEYIEVFPTANDPTPASAAAPRPKPGSTTRPHRHGDNPSGL